MLMEVNNLSKYYKKDISLIGKQESFVKVLNNISFTINENEIVGIVGESGCGKSTLTRQLAALEKPSQGQILFQGEKINFQKKNKLKKYHKDCQLIFQNNMTSLNPSMKIKNILKEPLNNHFNLNRKEKNEKIISMLERVELSNEILSRYPHELSGGERQRINICRALLLEPKLLICDEIVSSLDVSVQTSILNLIKELNKDTKMSLIFISHDIQVVKYFCHRILVMQKGEIVEHIDNKNKYFDIKHPYTKELFSSSPISHPNKRIV